MTGSADSARRVFIHGVGRISVTLVVSLLAVTLAACAPEDSAVPDNVAGSSGKEQLKDGAEPTDPTWGEENPAGVGDKNAELPATFPAAEFLIPVGTVIDDAGERSSDQWFVVLRAADQTAADTLWAAVISGSGFTATAVTSGDNGETFATLTSPTMSVDALCIPQDDKSVLLSYELKRVAA